MLRASAAAINRAALASASLNHEPTRCRQRSGSDLAPAAAWSKDPSVHAHPGTRAVARARVSSHAESLFPGGLSGDHSRQRVFASASRKKKDGRGKGWPSERASPARSGSAKVAGRWHPPSAPSGDALKVPFVTWKVRPHGLLDKISLFSRRGAAPGRRSK